MLDPSTRLLLSAIAWLALLPAAAGAQGHVYIYTDEDGNPVLTDKPPPEDSDLPKDIVNDEGVTVGHVQGKKTEEEIAAEKAAAERAEQEERERREVRVLLDTYHDVGEMLMHRDRRVELVKAQAHVTELYLRNQRLRMDQMRREAGQYLPYSDVPGAAPIPDDLVADMRDTQATIERHEQNLDRYRQQEQQIVDEFDRNIERFRALTAPD